jgi:thiamine pyrophosphokinase
MEIKDFKKGLIHTSEVTLVGPLVKKFPKTINHPFIYVDRGTNFRGNLRKMAKKGYLDISVGDGDSSNFPMDFNLPEEKDYSDLKFALDLIPPNVEKINLWGFLGGRRDHEIINFGEVNNWLLKSKNNVVFLFEKKVLAKSKGTLTLNIKGIFSLVVFQKTKIKLKGKCHYKLPKYKEISPLSSQGLSNLGDGEVTIEANGPFFLFLP